MFDRPAAGRAFFKELIRDHLDLAALTRYLSGIRPQDRAGRAAPTPGTEVITRGVAPEIICNYKSSRLKQYFNLTRATFRS
jgi:hypothetical protein